MCNKLCFFGTNRNILLIYFENLDYFRNCEIASRSFQLPRVIMYESVQLDLFVIADTRRSRVNDNHLRRYDCTTSTCNDSSNRCGDAY